MELFSLNMYNIYETHSEYENQIFIILFIYSLYITVHKFSDTFKNTIKYFGDIFDFLIVKPIKLCCRNKKICKNVFYFIFKGVRKLMNGKCM